MPYQKQNFYDGQVLESEALNKIEQGIVDNETAIEGKQPKGNYLTEHQTLKTINGESLVGEGDIKVKAEDNGQSEDLYKMMDVEPERVVEGSLYNVRTGGTYGNSTSYSHVYYRVDAGKTYTVSGSSASVVTDHPLGAFVLKDGSRVAIGTDPSTVYEDYDVTAPENVVRLVLNRNLPNVTISARTSVGIMERMDSVEEVLDTLGSLTEIVDAEPEKTVSGSIYNVQNGSTYGNNDNSLQHMFFKVEPGTKYYVSGSSASNGPLYALGGFLKSMSGAAMESFGTDNSTQYTDYEIKAPVGAVYMVVNRNKENIKIVVRREVGLRESLAGVSAEKNYSAKTLDGVIYEAKKNPFCFKAFDKGYISFVFDDLPSVIDSIAATFEEYNMPLCLAAIPENLAYSAGGLTSARGSYTTGMLRGAVCTKVQELGGEILAHNTDVINIDNQFDYGFMYDHFISTRELLEKQGFTIRGIIRSGGTGQINKSAEIERWVTGNYEYSNYGYAPQHNLERDSINQSISTVKSLIDKAVTNKTWLRIMAHDYNFGNGETFTGESDLRAILSYCQSKGITVVTYAHMFDTFRSSVLEERIAALEKG